MSRLSRSSRLLKAAEAALISSLEIYNKPSFAYREETFSILALNAWELLLKAKLLDLKQNDPRCLHVYFFPKTQAGAISKKARVKRNRTGNIMTVGIEACIVALEKEGIPVPGAVQKNLEALTEIRDNAIHYVNASPLLAKQVLEIGTASLRNFVELGKLWLGLDLSSYSLYLMPIGFLPSGAASATGVTVSNDEQNLVNYLAGLMNKAHDSTVPDYHVSLDVNISFKRTSTAAATAVIVTNDPNAVPVVVSEEDIRRQYPWDHAALAAKLRNRYLDFKMGPKYNALKKVLVTNPQYMRTRYLDPGNPRSSRKDFYNPNILREFDKTYTLRK
jgi:hypothetical protein